ncbi:MAG: hypothetical protein PVF58_15435 [Candidatus Methanofastidiosia archaeon]|jgi:hypothetical protein
MFERVLLVLVGGLVGLFSSIFIVNYKDWKLKKRTACIMKREIDNNLILIKDVIEEKIGYEFKNQVFLAYIKELPVLGHELAIDILDWYYFLELEHDYWKGLMKKDLHGKLVEYHKTRKGKELNEKWKNIFENGVKIVTDLETICYSHVNWKDILIGP